MENVFMSAFADELQKLATTMTLSPNMKSSRRGVFSKLRGDRRIGTSLMDATKVKKVPSSAPKGFRSGSTQFYNTEHNVVASFRRTAKKVGHLGAAAATGAAGLHAYQALTRKKKGHEKRAAKKESLGKDLAKGALIGGGAGIGIRGLGELMASPFHNKALRMRGVDPKLARKLSMLRIGAGAAAGIPLGIGIMLMKRLSKENK